ncbi:MAG: hypothetical protein JRJ51_11890 [Deltaproteobacteria bacterium]|nr:hypothetical protein [Deltaproteobacteria bacterium]MBW1943519.1 hypothetical protein [Deltaproteobacteria bacterium]
MRYVLTVVCCLLLVGCVTNQIDKAWVNQFKYDHNANNEKWTDAQLQQDQETCQESAFYLARGAFFMDKEEYARLYKKCMEEEGGWRLSETDEQKEPSPKKIP